MMTRRRRKKKLQQRNIPCHVVLNNNIITVQGKAGTRHNHYFPKKKYKADDRCLAARESIAH